MSKFATRLVTPIVPQPKGKILPPGWRWAKIGDLINAGGVFNDGDWVETVDQDPNGSVRLIQLADVGDGVYRNKSSRFLTAKKAAELGCTFLKCGDVLIARMPDPLGRACIFPDADKPSVTVVDVCIVRTEGGADHRWLMHFLNAPDFRVSVAALQSGSTRKRISRSNLAKLLLPVPPLAEQHRIVAEIEKHFTRLDAGVASLKRVQIALKRYRASVLKAACEGRLVPTEADLASQEGRCYEPASELLRSILSQRRTQWESAELVRLRADGKSSIGDNWKAKYQEPREAHPYIHGSEGLTKGWTWARLEQLGFTFGGLTKNPKRAKLPNKFSYLRVANVYANELRLNEIEMIGVDGSELEKLLVKAGDLLIVEGNGSKDQIGRLAIWDGSISNCVHQNHLIKVRLTTVGLSKWVLVWLLSPRGRYFIQQVASSTSGLYTLSVNKVGEFPIALPPLAEQKRIVAEVERRFSVIEELEAVVWANLKRAKRLRQSILHSAFAGKL